MKLTLKAAKWWRHFRIGMSCKNGGDLCANVETSVHVYVRTSCFAAERVFVVALLREHSAGQVRTKYSDTTVDAITSCHLRTRKVFWATWIDVTACLYLVGTRINYIRFVIFLRKMPNTATNTHECLLEHLTILLKYSIILGHTYLLLFFDNIEEAEILIGQRGTLTVGN